MVLVFIFGSLLMLYGSWWMWKRIEIQGLWKQKKKKSDQTRKDEGERVEGKGKNDDDDKKQEVDLLFRNVTVVDGSGRKRQEGRDVGIKGGKIVWIGEHSQGLRARQEIDGQGQWLLPGLIDIHTHYDCEVLVAPGLEESLRHGVTTVVFGNCSISAALGTEQQLCDLFCRVENLPRAVIERWLAGRIGWSSLAGYMAHLKTLPLGPNIAAFLGHSNVRLHVLGLQRSLQSGERPSAAELAQMAALVDQALALGFVGMSIDLLPWHRLDGLHSGTPIPSCHASRSEYVALAEVLRRRGGILQCTPNLVDRRGSLFLMSLSSPPWWRPGGPLKTTILAALDPVKNSRLYLLPVVGSWLVNHLLHGDVRFQSLTTPFVLYVDGLLSPVTEEWPTGQQIMNAPSSAHRKQLFSDPAFVAQFEQEWLHPRGETVFHRQLDLCIVESSPEAAHVGRSLADIAQAAGCRTPSEAVRHFVQLLARYDTELRWRTTVANGRPHIRRWLANHPQTLIGFTDSGAHARAMAFYDNSLRYLAEELAHTSPQQPLAFEAAVKRVTFDAARWFGFDDRGLVEVGKAADLVLLNPRALQSGLAAQPVLIHDPQLGVSRMVNRNDPNIIEYVVVNGAISYHLGQSVARSGTVLSPSFTKK